LSPLGYPPFRTPLGDHPSGPPESPLWGTRLVEPPGVNPLGILSGGSPLGSAPLESPWWTRLMDPLGVPSLGKHPGGPPLVTPWVGLVMGFLKNTS
jgi:hypothetical protein